MPRESKENLPWSGPMGGVQELGGEAKAGQVWLADWLRSRETLRLTWDSSVGTMPVCPEWRLREDQGIIFGGESSLSFFRDIFKGIFIRIEACTGVVESLGVASFRHWAMGILSIWESSGEVWPGTGTELNKAHTL